MVLGFAFFQIPPPEASSLSVSTLARAGRFWPVSPGISSKMMRQDARIILPEIPPRRRRAAPAAPGPKDAARQGGPLRERYASAAFAAATIWAREGMVAA